MYFGIHVHTRRFAVSPTESYRLAFLFQILQERAEAGVPLLFEKQVLLGY